MPSGNLQLDKAGFACFSGGFLSHLGHLNNLLSLRRWTISTAAVNGCGPRAVAAERMHGLCWLSFEIACLS